jgi:tetratricopeptide (TPR) repeat protein
MNPREGDAVAPTTDIDPGTTAPPAPAVLCEAALKHLLAGRLLEAQVSCQQALAIDASRADSLHLMGLVSLQAQHYDHAVEWLSRAIRQEPRPEYLSTLALALKQSGRLEEALAVSDKAVQLRPDDAELWKALGAMLTAVGRPADALLAYQHVLTLDPDHGEAARLCGALLHQMARFEEALAYLERSNALQEGHASTLFARARTLRALGRSEECLADYLRLHALTPGDPILCNNIGDALLLLERHQEALDWFDRALELGLDAAEVLVNKGFALFQLNRLDEAIAIYARVKALAPHDANSSWQLAHLQLQTGNFADGWREREARWMVGEFSPDYPKFSQPKWLGEQDISDKTILICADEGIGDTLQFARFVPLLAARGARVVLVVQDALVSLLSRMPGVLTCLPFSTRALPPFDLHCPIMSLPFAFGTTLQTIPSPDYLPRLRSARVQAWKDRLGAHDRLRVGLVWSGNPNQKNDRNRSMPFAMLTTLFDLDATFVSLQKDIRPDDRAALSTRSDILDPTSDLTDFAETAALIENLDLVATVCTSVAHLAGTLACPTWVMLPYVGDWRWLADRDDSPWYPSVRLFRQDATRDYAPVIARVRRELEAMIREGNWAASPRSATDC